jgi:hypothetical protein
MTKIDRIKEYFMVNNITKMGGCSVTYATLGSANGKEIYTYSFWNDDDPNTFTFIICLKNKNTSYLIDFLSPKRKYQKIGDFEKGMKVASEIGLYYDSEKYIHGIPKQFTDPQKQIHCESGLANIEIYKKFWEEKMIEFPQYADQIKKFRLS